MDLGESNGLEKRNGDQLDPQLIPQFGAQIGMVPGTSTGAGTSAGSPFPLWHGMPNLSNPMVESFNPSILNQSSSKFPFSGVLPPGLPNFPSEPGFIERAARLSCFGANGSFNGLMNNSVLNQNQKGELNSLSIGSGSNHGNQLNNQGNVEKNTETIEGAEDRISNGDNANADSSQNDSVAKKRKRTNQDVAMEQGQASMKSQDEAGKQNSEKNEAENNGSKNSGKNGKDAADPKDYIHVRARRGQATNSHSLAERVRREKISERMKYLQELVPGCSKVTGKAVMLDEIINYVQSLQRQVEFLSMKLAAVNPRLDLNIEALLSKDILHGRGLSSTGFTHEMFHSQLHPSQPGLLPPGLPGMLNPSDPFRRAINNPLSAINPFKDPNHQMPTSWQDELHNVMSMNFATNPQLSTQDAGTKPGEGFQL